MPTEDKHPEQSPQDPKRNQEGIGPEQSDQRIVSRVIEDEMRTSYLDYAMSVIVARALPDVRDGLKPVHRRVLFGMHELGLLHNKPYRKSARIVGDVLGKYHPHGDSAVYQTLVRMVQDFSLRYPLADGQGNFGSIDGDNAAAMRYTEARMTKIAEHILEDLEKETVPFVPNFDTTLQEPSVMPCKFPNLLVNGSSGIAVGMATNIPPHNMTEIIEGVCHLIENPEAALSDIMQFVKGPDFPTSGIILGEGGIRQAYVTGRGRVRIRAKTHIEDLKGSKKKAIIVDEIPYQVTKSTLLEDLAKLVRDGIVEGISDIRDESDREGIRVVFELKKDASEEVVLNQLFSHTRLEVVFSINNLALVDGQPVTLPLLAMMREFIKHRQVMVRKRTEFDLRKTQERAHILEGLKIALDNIDRAIELIKKSDAAEKARHQLMDAFGLTQIQAQAILDMKLQRLTSLEQNKIRDELDEALKTIEHLKKILADEKEILAIIKQELIELKEKYGDKRRTEILPGEHEDIDMEDLIEHQTVVITKSHKGYIKRQPMNVYRQQRRGGRGIVAATTIDDDFVEDLFVSDTHSTLLFFSNMGKVHWLKVYEIPEASRGAKGKPIVNLLDLAPNEHITAMVPVAVFEPNKYLFMATRNGVVKKTLLEDFSHPRKGGIIAIVIDEGDELIAVQMTDGKQEIMLVNKNGNAIRFSEEDVRPMGRVSRGVRGVSLREGENDEVISLVVAQKGDTLLTITENGYGKRTDVEEYRLTGRGGVGVINIICSERNGKVVGALAVNDSDEIMALSQKGIAIRSKASDVSVIGRNTQGVRLMRLDDGDKVVSVEKIITEQQESAMENADIPPSSDAQPPTIAKEIKEIEIPAGKEVGPQEDEFGK